MKLIYNTGFLLLLMLTVNACFSVKYSFSGYDIPIELSTASIQYFDNSTSFAPPSLGQDITDELRTKLERETRLTIVDGIGDVDFSGEIVTFEAVSKSLRASDVGDIAGTQEFIMTMKVRYSNFVDPEQDFEQSFTKKRDFQGSETFEDAQEQYTDEMIEEILEDVLVKAFANW